jgi:hypothetical protein
MKGIRFGMFVAALLAAAAPARAAQDKEDPLPAVDQDAFDVAVEALEAAAEMLDLAEAEDFMLGYERDLRAGDRAAIARRYHRSGAWRVGHGEKRMESWAQIEAYYAGAGWSPPASFQWRDLSYERLSADAFVVVGLFDWGPTDGRAPVTYSYTGLLVRQDGELRIRLEDESGPRSP